MQLTKEHLSSSQLGSPARVAKCYNKPISECRKILKSQSQLRKVSSTNRQTTKRRAGLKPFHQQFDSSLLLVNAKPYTNAPGSFNQYCKFGKQTDELFLRVEKFDKITETLFLRIKTSYSASCTTGTCSKKILWLTTQATDICNHNSIPIRPPPIVARFTDFRIYFMRQMSTKKGKTSVHQKLTIETHRSSTAQSSACLHRRFNPEKVAEDMAK